jgi:hypothetical protein
VAIAVSTLTLLGGCVSMEVLTTKLNERSNQNECFKHGKNGASRWGNGGFDGVSGSDYSDDGEEN